MTTYFDGIDRNFGFGCMRLPMLGEEVDIEQTKQMVDLFLEKGFRYFDTAHGYINGKSELAIREAVSSRYPRDRFLLTNKLSYNFFEKQEDIRPLFQQQLEACGVEYFDCYLMHALSKARLARYREAKAFETALELKQEGKIRHIGISFHDSAQALEEILQEFPMIEVVQLQFNYVDFEDEKVQSRKCYEVCRKYGKPVIVMEPVKGGSLVNLPAAAQNIFDRLKGGSNASYAIRFAAGFDGIMMVLSGMSNLEQLRDNVGFMEHFQPLSPGELEAVSRVRAVFRSQGLINCTACRYCTEVCPQGIPIPELFASLNALRQRGEAIAVDGPAPDACLKCGKCEESCPQGLPIRELLVAASEER